MNPIELRASLGLAGLYALRMLGMFLILPVFAVYAGHLPGGDNHALVGFAFGAYGLTQALLQLPFGMWSDRAGRKKVIYIGLLLFAVGSVMCALADHIVWLIVGRAVQGAGAISAAITAMLADLTREEHRTKAMAMIGGSIATTFAVSLVAAPKLAEWIGLPGIFALTAVLAVAALIGVHQVIPNPTVTRHHSDAEADTRRLPAVLRHPQLMRLNYGVFALHAAQMAMFTVMPLLLKQIGGLSVAHHWWVYLPVVLVGFVFMVPAVIVGEKRRKLKPVFLFAIALMLVAQLGMTLWLPSLTAIVLWLAIYFIAFNILEATQPSLISKIAPSDAKGTAMGVYNTCQSASMAVGAALAGWLYQHFQSPVPVFALCSALVGIWLLVAWGMQPPLPVKTRMFHIDDQWSGDAAALSAKLAAIDGVKEAVVLMDERVVLLKVLQDGWDEATAQQLIAETH
ncbi:Predicted arabinose efflux permease, MFS family [Andreprevotia lacus DSM 23236]|jgi:predicted MFS family arabinose efflux permease|uniref:Predicted arabinose efflux permease, MFS family n=1 Tax=Andreprevotia lacus DSM 23236 TaxID=1121001 RepID=A0A1W1XKP1_9NEIS|nr:MFS transporter [Andreprevotia lacus]SMC24485.1 Predicted arabinose efflux permease, MFS family [Andreprevotia lacus DSM 23236]